jgi:sugar phosphate permease
MNNNENIKLYSYRWVMVIIFFVLNVVMQLHLLTFAPITGDAAKFYGVTDLQINFLAMLPMIFYALLSIPISYIIDRFGIRIGVGIGALMLGLFGLLKGVYATNYMIILAAQVGLSIAQPFIVNACTRVSAVWFPIVNRATITGIFFLAQFFGIAMAIGAPPFIVAKYSIPGMLMFYGIVSLVCALIFLVFMREKPPTPPCHEGHEVRMSTYEGLKNIFRVPSMIIMLVQFFFCFGIFNAVTACLEQIFRKRGFSPDEVGTLGAVMIVSGIVGAIFWPYLSDKYLKRKPFMLICLFLIIPSLAGIALGTGHLIVLISSAIFGFTLLGAGPVGFQYAAELSYPTPEATSQGILQLTGQLSGIIFILGMNAFGDYNQEAVAVFIFLALISFLIGTKLKESTIIKTD